MKYIKQLFGLKDQVKTKLYYIRKAGKKQNRNIRLIDRD